MRLCSRNVTVCGVPHVVEPAALIGAATINNLRLVAHAHRRLEQERVGQTEARRRGAGAERE